MGPRVAGRLQGQDLVGQRHKLVALSAVADAVQVDMAVDQPRQDCLVVVGELANGRALGRDDGFLRAHRGDLVAGDQHGRPL